MLVSLLTCGALSWPDGFPLCHLPSSHALIDHICSVRPTLTNHYRSEECYNRLSLGAVKPHVGAAVIVLILSSLIDRSAVTFW